MRSLAFLAFVVVAAVTPAQAQQDTSALPPQEIGTIAVGQPRTGILEPGDHTMEDGTWADVWYVSLAAGQRIVIDLHSARFDSYLQLLDPWGTKLAEDDNSGPGSDARIVFAVTTAGRYQIVVNNYEEDRRTGPYQLSVR